MSEEKKTAISLQMSRKHNLIVKINLNRTLLYMIEVIPIHTIVLSKNVIVLGRVRTFLANVRMGVQFCEVLI